MRTLTRNPGRDDPCGGQVAAVPLDFSDPDGLRRSMEGAGVLCNTYWIRFGRGRTTFDQAAARAGVGRIVHFSVANVSPEFRLPYFRGKWQVEKVLKDTGLPYAIIRPTLVFGEGDLLLNNMAWALRRFPFFPVFGKGDYPVQPIYAEDLAAHAVDAAGPETFTFEELLRLLASEVGAHDEVEGLTAGLLTPDGIPTGGARLDAWLKVHAKVLRRRYVSELRRSFRWQMVDGRRHLNLQTVRPPSVTVIVYGRLVELSVNPELMGPS